MTATWTTAQFVMDQPPPALDSLLVATIGAAFVGMAVAKEKSPPPTKDATVANEPEAPASDATGTFYCQAGDHIVNSVVWLETITLGCRPCMEKLGRDISTKEWMPRLWSVGPGGTRRAADIPKPKPIIVQPAKESNSPFAKDPFFRSRANNLSKANPKKYISEHQDWTCARCARSYDDTTQGFYNSVEGFVCNLCQPIAIPGGTNQSKRQQDSTRRAKIVERQSEQIEKARAKAAIESEAKQFQEAIHPLQQAMDAIHGTIQAAWGLPGVIMGNETVVPDHKKALNWEVRDGMVVVDADAAIEATRRASVPIKKTGHNAAIVIEGDVIGSQVVECVGHNARITIQGDVGSEARVVADGHNATIEIHGHVHRDAFVEARGHNAEVSYGTRDQSAYVQAEGHNGKVRGRVVDQKTTPRPDQQQARADLAATYGLPYKNHLDEWDAYFNALETPSRGMYVCTCVRCGKYDTSNPVMGGSKALDAQYKCAECLQSPREWPKHRDAVLRNMTNLATVRTKAKMPKKGKVGEWVYVASTDQIFTWMDGQGDLFGWVQVSMPSGASPFAEIKTPAHTHVWAEAWGESRKFCRECGAGA